MINESIEKVQKEMLDLKHPYAERLGTYIIAKLLCSEENAAKIMDKDKSLAKCIEKIKSNARKDANNGVAMEDDETVFEWLREYYGVEEPGKAAQADNSVGERKVISLVDMI